jgi:hypothetical protein
LCDHVVVIVIKHKSIVINPHSEGGCKVITRVPS